MCVMTRHTGKQRRSACSLWCTSVSQKLLLGALPVDPGVADGMGPWAGGCKLGGEGVRLCQRPSAQVDLQRSQIP